MKKTIFILASIILGAIVSSSFTTIPSGPKLYPELEAFFKSLNDKQTTPSHQQALVDIKDNVAFSDRDFEDWNLIFYCSENTFRSQASQVFAHTLCYAEKHKRIKVFSAGVSTGDISPKLIAYLTKIGYKITSSTGQGQTTYLVRFSDQADPIKLYSKTMTDQSLPKSIVTSVIVCDIKNETDCATLKTESTPVNLPFVKVNSGDNDEKIDATLKSIASEMLYVAKK